MLREPRLPGLSAALFRSLIPYAEREEVLGDLAAEHAERAAAEGRLAARLWLWRQLLGSLPALFRRPGVRIGAMNGQLRAVAASLKPTFEYLAEFDKTRSPSITPLREHLVGKVRPSLLATLAGMALILLMACVNVAALMLGQVAGRNTELAVRVALGAGRQRLLQQLVIESLLIGGLAGIAGALLAAGGFQVLVGALPLGALAETATLDWTLFWAAVAVALLAAAVVSLIPGIVLWRGNLQGSIATARTAGMSGRGGRLDGGLVVAQIALAVLLAAGAGLTRLLSSLLYGIGATDVQALAGAVAALLLVGGLAALSPALRASRTDPASVLRDQ